MIPENADELVFIVAILFGLGIFLYFVALGLAFILDLKCLSNFNAIAKSNLAFNIGIPASGISAFGIVSVFWSAFPQHGEAGSPLDLKFLDLQFSGPSGPITLWVLCFLAFVFAMHLLGERKNK